MQVCVACIFCLAKIIEKKNGETSLVDDGLLCIFLKFLFYFKN